MRKITIFLLLIVASIVFVSVPKVKAQEIVEDTKIYTISTSTTDEFSSTIESGGAVLNVYLTSTYETEFNFTMGIEHHKEVPLGSIEAVNISLAGREGILRYQFTMDVNFTSAGSNFSYIGGLSAEGTFNLKIGENKASDMHFEATMNFTIYLDGEEYMSQVCDIVMEGKLNISSYVMGTIVVNGTALSSEVSQNATWSEDGQKATVEVNASSEGSMNVHIVDGVYLIENLIFVPEYIEVYDETSGNLVWNITFTGEQMGFGGFSSKAVSNEQKELEPFSITLKVVKPTEFSMTLIVMGVVAVAIIAVMVLFIKKRS